jgi:hypothetical protein
MCKYYDCCNHFKCADNSASVRTSSEQGFFDRNSSVVPTGRNDGSYVFVTV